MKLFAQQGAAQGEKTTRGIECGYIDGVIYSPRDIGAAQLRSHISDVAAIDSSAEQLFDPQYYAAYNVTDPEARLGRLASCEEYAAYFRPRTRRELERASTIARDVEDCLRFQSGLGLSGMISPNILITRSLDSIQASIAKDFIKAAGPAKSRLDSQMPVYATLALSREALLDRGELFSFLQDITVLDDPPDGFYLLIAASSDDARADIFHSDVIAGWLWINQSLSVNGYRVINGYSDLLTPFLQVAGATAGATGWWLNSRTFSLGRFLPSTGGRSPIQRYLSKTLLNRITYIELEQIMRLRLRRRDVPNVLNDLGSDDLYPPEEGYEPERANEVLQTWESIKSLSDDLCGRTTISTLRRCHAAVARAVEAYDLIKSLIRLDPKSNDDHLSAIEEGLRLFARLAEIGDGET